MDTSTLIKQLKAERDRLDKAIAALEKLDVDGGGAASPAKAGKRTGKRRLSAEARKRISQAAKKRWAKYKSAKKA